MANLLIEMRGQVGQFFRGHPALHRIVHPAWHRARRMLRSRRLARLGPMERDPEAGNRLIREAIISGQPHGIAKIGSLEAEAMACFMAGQPYPEVLRGQMVTNVGLYPGTKASIDSFCAAYLAALADIDLLAAWGQPGEAELLARVPNGRRLIHIDSFEPWYFDAPWSAALAGKRVVVLHPFAQTIQRQFARRAQVWGTRGVLPSFTLRTVRMPLSPSLAPPHFPDWQAQFAALAAEIDAEPYDVVLAGAGGISLLVASHAARAGRVGFHMGGLTQILFGVLGRRWEGSKAVTAARNDAWVRPSGDEAPPTVTQVEQGCYW